MLRAKGIDLSKVLVLGSNSFGACHLIDDLLSENYSVIGVSRSELKSSSFLKYLKNSKVENFQFIKLDINREFDRLIATVESHQPEFIVDFAGQGMVAESWDNPSSWYETNIVSKVRFHQKLMKYNFLHKYIRISTPEVYGSSETLLFESSPYKPSTPYALSHATIDQHLSLIQTQYNFPVVIGRFANFYGPGQQLFRIIPKTFMKFKNSQKLMLHGGGLSQRAFIHGADVSSAIRRLISHGSVGEVYHFSSDEIYSIYEIVVRIADILGLEPDKMVEAVADRPGKDHRYMMDTSKSESNLNWSPVVDLHTGLEQVESWIQSNLEEFNAMSLEYKHVN